MIVKLSEYMAKLLIREVDGVDRLIKSSRVNEIEDNIELNISDIDEVQLLINDEIVYRGLDNQETANNLGKRLYALYDEILYQKHNN